MVQDCVLCAYIQLKGYRLRADLILVWRILHGMCTSLDHLLHGVKRPYRTRGHSLKLFVSFRLGLYTAETLTDSSSIFKAGFHRELGDLLFEFD